MMNRKTIWLIGIGLLGMSFYRATNPELFYIPKGWPKPNYPMHQQHIQPKIVELGEKLFYDPILSRDNTISCSSCHSVYHAFAHTDHALSHGIDNRIGKRNAPGLFNLAWQKKLMWDGAIHSLDAQPLAPITNADEMDETLEHVVQKLNAHTYYRTAFKTLFNTDSITTAQVTQALSQFMLTLISANSKYDKVMRKEKDEAFTAQEAKGYTLFKQYCNTCHTEPLFTNVDFANNGLPMDTSLMDKGRYQITHQTKDSLMFKVPSLRNVELTYPYMHDGRFTNLEMVIFHYSEQIASNVNTHPSLKHPLHLQEEEKNNLIAFLKTLTDEDFIKQHQYKPFLNNY